MFLSSDYYGQQPQGYPAQPPSQQQQQQGGFPQQPQQFTNQVGGINGVASTTKIPRLSKGDNSAPKKGELAPTEANLEKDYENFLLKDLKPSNFQMETPLAAYFTLIFGSSVCFCVCFLFCCRVKNQKRRGRKRNLASDAGDGDYLVNGMYL